MQLWYALVPDRRARWAVVIGLWTVIGTLSAVHWQLFYYFPNPYKWWELFRVKLALWYAWGAVTPVILWLGWRFRLARPHLARNLLVLVPLSVVTTLAYLLVYTGLVVLNLLKVPGRNPSFANILSFVVAMHSTWFFLAFWATIAIENTAGYYRRFHERQLQASQLETQLVQVQLTALRFQLQPHFLFNTLHSIVALVQQQRTNAAIEMLTRLSELLRYTLEHLGRHEVPLREELAFLGRYIEIEQVRFSDRLTLQSRIDQVTLPALVPSFILQPLVENAVRHGIENRPGDGLIEISSARKNGSLVLEIRDNGIGVGAAGSRSGGSGLGLSATRARLDALYHDDYVLDLLDAEGGGTLARLVIPYYTTSRVPHNG